MYNIYTSNRLESLCQTMADSIRNTNDVFGKEVILTQSTGMNAWLKTELAMRNGVFANFEFQNQDELFAGIYQLLFHNRLQNNRDSIKYMIYECLNTTDFLTKFDKVGRYYQDQYLRRFQLAARIADLFDQYQLYRPEMIENWDKEIPLTENSAEEWQQWLWVKLNTESRIKLRNNVINEMEVQKDLILKAYPRISLFGISIFTEFHLDFFKSLAKHTQVDFYLCLPTNPNNYQNELLQSYGSKALELSDIFVKKFKNIDFRPIKNESESLLARIQNKITDNSTNLEFTEDDSIQINSCYTLVREAECVYNYLLDLFEKDKELRPRDILIMTTDINKYAPFIKAVFRNAPVNIPFQVSGAANNSDDTIAAAVEQILNFTEDDLTSEKVISLLEQKRIKQRFGIEDCNYIRSIVRKANIRFGRENRAEDDTQYVSWKYGLEKILLGYAMLTDEEYPIGENLTLYPFKDAEASVSHDLFRLKAFVETLQLVIDVQKESKTLADWKLFLLNEVIAKMVYSDDFKQDDRAELSSIYKVLSFIDKLELEADVPFSIFLEELKLKLFTESREVKLNTGRITVSSPIPVRGLPYKVVCFLGLNNDVFPRKDIFMGFDLLGEKYLVGDRNKKETDKYLFLDTILAARDKLYLSYIGQSAKDNTEIPPSIVVDTFLDYISQEKFVVMHPLHGFSSKYQKDDKRLFTYLYAEQGNGFNPKAMKPEELTEVSVYTFVKFFEHPIEWYFKNILGIKYEEKEETLSETELFELDPLQKWIIKNNLLRVDKRDVESYLQKGIKEGVLPLKNLGRVTLDNLIEETSAIRLKYQSLTCGIEEQNIAIDLIIDNIQFTGTIDGVFNRQYIACSFSKSSEKNMVRAYLKTLLLCANDEIASAFLINADGESTNLSVFSSDEAKSKIKTLLVYFRKGMTSPLKFTLKATKPPQNAVLSITSVVNSFKEDADGNYVFDPNKYMQNLVLEGYFDDFNETDFAELKTLAELLNLKTV